MKRYLLALALLPLGLDSRAAEPVPATDEAIAAVPAEPAPPTEWDVAAETVVVFNTAEPASEPLARHYAAQRGIAAERVIGLKTAVSEEISRSDFDASLREPLLKLFREAGWWSFSNRHPTTGQQVKSEVITASKVSFLALMYGIPSKISRAKPNPATAVQDEASVDSELAALGRRPDANLNGPSDNPFYAQQTRLNKATNCLGVLLVGRLDGPSPEVVKRCIDDAIAVEQTGLLGRGVIDLALKTGPYEEGEEWLRKTAISYRRAGIPFYVDRHEELIPPQWPLPETALYFGWYSGGITGALANPTFRFKRGAVACHLHSFSASTVRSTQHGWVGPLLNHGAAATMGNVWEPYLTFTVHFDTLNEHLLAGHTLAEAAWAATPGLSWMNVVVGDPLYRPFGHRSMGDAQDRDFALYRALVEKHASDSDTAGLKKDVLALADSRQNPRLLEFLALLASAESKINEAADMLDHARSLHKAPEDQLRTLLYEVDLLGRTPSPSTDRRARTLVESAMKNDAFRGLDAFPALKALSQ